MSAFDLATRDSNRFNANKLSLPDVARDFVTSSHLHDLASSDNVIVTGPRGSGKTTLLKMMTRQALDEWDHELARQLLEKPVLCLYVGLDMVQRSQLNSPLHESADLGALRRSYLSLELLQIILDSAFHEIEKGRAQLTEAANESLLPLADVFQVRLEILSLEALYSSVRSALVETSRVLQAVADGKPIPSDSSASTRSLPSLADVLIETQRLVTGMVSGLPQRWVLLFDELEYLPGSARDQITGLIRSLPHQFGLKLAVTPLSVTGNYLREVEESYLAAGHDFKRISLAYQKSRDILIFSRALHERKLEDLLGEETGTHEVVLEDYLGISAFTLEGARLDDPSLETVRSPRDFDLISALSAIQPRFAEYARRAGIASLEELRSLDAIQRAAKVRKPWPVMFLWNERLRETTDELGARPRKTRGPFTGCPTFLLLGDGNPREILNMLNDLVDLTPQMRTSATQGLMFPPEVQTQAIWNGVDRQLALANVYLSRHGVPETGIRALDLLDLVGNVFEENVYFGPTFNPDPMTSFRINNPLPPEFSAALVDMVFTGALVDLTAKSELGPDGLFIRPGDELVGRRFRLSYLLSAKHWLPIRKGRQMAFDQILQRGGLQRRLRSEAAPSSELTMF